MILSEIIYILKKCIRWYKVSIHLPRCNWSDHEIPETSPALGLRKPELEVWDLQNQLVFRRKNLEQYKFHEQSKF